jgi:hypothetical protein
MLSQASICLRILAAWMVVWPSATLYQAGMCLSSLGWFVCHSAACLISSSFNHRHGNLPWHIDATLKGHLTQLDFFVIGMGTTNNHLTDLVLSLHSPY